PRRANLFRPAAGTPAVSPHLAYRPACRPSPGWPAPRPARRLRSTAWSCAVRLRVTEAIRNPVLDLILSPRLFLPEVQQATRDDVALHFGGAAVDGGRPRVQELGAPVGVVEFDGARQQVACGVVKPLFGVGQQHFVDR